MNTKYLIILFFELIFLSNLASAQNISVIPISQNVQTGEPFYVGIDIDSENETVQFAHVELDFPAANMTALTITYNNLMGGYVAVEPGSGIQNGKVVYGISLTSGNATAVSGSFITIQMYPATTANGTSLLTLSNIDIMNTTANHLNSSNFNLSNGSVNISYFITSSSSTVFKTLPHNVRFAVQDYLNNPQSSVMVSVQGYNTTTGSFNYLASLIGLNWGQTPINTDMMNGTTGTDGTISFMLDPTINYRVTFTRSPDVDITWSLYPKEDYYMVFVSLASSGINALCGNVAFNLTNTVYNATANTLGLTYTDTANTTTEATFFVQDVNGTYLFSGSTVYPISWSPTYNVNSSLGNTYFWGFNATTSSCTGHIAQTQVITFRYSGKLIDLHISEVYYQWISIMLLVFTASLFSAKKIKFGVVIVPLSAGMYSFFGWFTVNPIILGSAIVLGILIYIRMSEVKVNF